MAKGARRIMLPMILILAIIGGILAISFYYLYGAIQAYSSGAVEEALYYALLAIVGIGISIYVTRMVRKRTVTQKLPPKVTTTIECKKCDFKNLRQFEKGDYVFKSVENCAKCNEQMLISAIYAEETKDKK